MKRIKINAGKPYEVHIGSGILSGLGDSMSEILCCKTAVIIADETVDRLYGDAAEASIKKSGFQVLRYAFSGGEQNKSMETASNILEFLAEKGVTRSDCLVALGGGITGDVTGFCAATYQRGIDFIQVPTTLLAAVDSSVGGKTGVNLRSGKNLAGAFWQQQLVVMDTDCLKTLPDEIFADGMAEVIKYGVLEDEAFFCELKAGGAKLQEIIAKCVEIKAGYVAADERDTGERQKLNLGHTFGHAIERVGEYSVSHGRAVAIGMVMAARAAEVLGVSKEACAGEIAELLEKNGLPSKTEIKAQDLLPAMLKDKKRGGDEITLVLPVKIGECVLKKLPVSEVEGLLREVCW